MFRCFEVLFFIYSYLDVLLFGITCHCVQGYCNNFFVYTCIFLQLYFLVILWCFSCYSAPLLSQIIIYIFELYFTVTLCFVRYFCYYTLNSLPPPPPYVLHQRAISKCFKYQDGFFFYNSLFIIWASFF